jgi:RHS repeat-associated protein
MLVLVATGCGSPVIPTPTPGPGPTGSPSTSATQTPVPSAGSTPTATPVARQPGPLDLEECDPAGYMPCEHLAAIVSLTIAGTGAALTYSSEWAPGRADRPAAWDASPLGLGGWSVDVLQRYDSTNGILIGGDGSWRFAEAVPLPHGETAVPSFDGRLAYVFDNGGHHVRTVDAILGIDLITFSYDDAGRLLNAKGSLDNVSVDLSVERGPDGALSGIVGTGGVRTEVIGDGAGHIGSINHPDGGRDGFFSDAHGLITVHIDPAGGVTHFEYDDAGRLASATDADGVSLTYERTSSDNEVDITVVPALGDAASYRGRAVDGGIERSYVAPGGPTTTVLLSADGQRMVALPDGRTITVGATPDPRWGLAAPILTPVVEQRPDGSVRRTDIQDVFEPTAGDALAAAAWSRTTTIDGDTYVERLDTARRAIVAVDPLGLETTTVYDEGGRVIALDVPGQPAAAFSYDDQGRLATDTRGNGLSAAVTTYSYGPDGRVTVTLPDGSSQTLLYDAAGRLVEQAAGDGSSLLSTYDSSGRAILVRPGGELATTIGYSPAGRITAFVPPAIAPDSSYEVRTYDVAGRLAAVAGPGTRAITLTYDDAGRLASEAFDRGQLATTYDAATNRPATIAAPDGVLTTYGYAGDLHSSVAWTGPVAGDVHLEFDARGLATAEIVNSGTPVESTYDGAGRLTSVGAVEIQRDTGNGLPAAASLGDARTSWQYDANGLVTRASTDFDGNQLIAWEYARDAFGRITRVTESSTAGQRITEYAYDLAGRLATVTVDGAVVEESAYDTRGNRVSVSTAGAPVAAAYDARNQLDQWAGARYEYEPDGTLARRRDGDALTTFDVDDLGVLRAVGLPDGRQVAYLVDGSGQRIGRRVGGQLTAGYLYRPDGSLVAQLDAAGNVVARFTRGDDGRLISMERDGRNYLIVTDTLGSPRLVVDAATGMVAEAIEYDPWGRVVSDTNPGFQPFGLAGGLLDPDTGLVHFGARDYDPSVGRWIEPDPMRFASSDANLYAYAGNDPVNRSDPTGLDAPPNVHNCTNETPCTHEYWHKEQDGSWTVCRGAGGGRECYPWHGPDPIPGGQPPSGGTWPPQEPPPPTAPSSTPSPAPSGPDPGKPGGGFWCLGICFPPGGGVCAIYCSSGDPHVRTADGLDASFQGAGEYLMVASADGSVQIQARQQPPGNLTSVTITTAVAAYVAGDRVGVYLADNVSLMVNGEVLPDGDLTRALPHGGSVTRQGSLYFVEWPDGSRLTVERRGAHLDYGFVPDPAVAPTLTGLLGTPDGDSSNDLVSRDGSLTLDPASPDFFEQLHGPFAASWRISQQESLFDYAPGESTATFTLPGIPSTAAEPEGLDQQARARAEDLCRAVGVTREPTLSDCIVDVGFTGDPSFASSAVAVEAATAGSPPVPGTIQPIAAGDTVAGLIASSNQTDRFSFAAAAGEVVYLVAHGPCVDGLSWRLLTPTGEQMAGQPACAELGRQALTVAGSYVVEVYGEGAATGAYSFSLSEVPPPRETAITFGTSVADRISAVGERRRYTFHADAGQVIFLAATGPNVDGLSWVLRGPNGEYLFSGYTSNDLGPWTVIESGTFTIEIYSDTTATGPYSFELRAGP